MGCDYYQPKHGEALKSSCIHHTFVTMFGVKDNIRKGYMYVCTCPWLPGKWICPYKGYGMMDAPRMRKLEVVW